MEFPQKCVLKVHLQSPDPVLDWARFPHSLIETAKCYISNHIMLFLRPLPLGLLRHCQLVSITQNLTTLAFSSQRVLAACILAAAVCAQMLLTSLVLSAVIDSWLDSRCTLGLFSSCCSLVSLKPLIFWTLVWLFNAAFFSGLAKSFFYMTFALSLKREVLPSCYLQDSLIQVAQEPPNVQGLLEGEDK